jgi:anti-sigma28 factor (negative regulator of flagellin synthesis)
MKNFSSDTSDNKHNTGLRHDSTQYIYRRDLSQTREDQNIAKNMAEQLELMEQYVTRIPVVDLQKRNRIRDAIAMGNYVIDPLMIAEKFLAFETELFGTRKKR